VVEAKGNKLLSFASSSLHFLLTHIFQKGRGILIFCIPDVLQVFLPIALSFSPYYSTFCAGADSNAEETWAFFSLTGDLISDDGVS
jgi:hypothetical protein